MVKVRPIAFRPALVPLVGDHVGALVLSQIMYWHDGRLRVVVRGKLWLAKSRSDMCDECQITLKQYKRVIPLLISQGWIISERHLFSGKVTPHIRLTEKGEDFRLTGKLLLVSEGAINCTAETNQLVPCGSNPLVPLGSIQLAPHGSILYTETTTGTTTETTHNAQPSSAPENQAQVSEEFQEQQVKAEDVLKKFENKPVEGQNIQAMSICWRKEVALAGDGQFSKSLTLKEIGQLKIVHKQVPDKAVELVKYVIRNWHTFAAEVQTQKAVAIGLTPNTGAFCAHFEIALQLIAQPVKPKVVEQPLYVLPVIKPVENTDLATKEDVQETLALLAAMDKKGPT